MGAGARPAATFRAHDAESHTPWVPTTGASVSIQNPRMTWVVDMLGGVFLSGL